MAVKVKGPQSEQAKKVKKINNDQRLELQLKRNRRDRNFEAYQEHLQRKRTGGELYGDERQVKNDAKRGDRYWHNQSMVIDQLQDAEDTKARLNKGFKGFKTKK